MRSAPAAGPLSPKVHPDLVPDIPQSILESDHGPHGPPSAEVLSYTSLQIADELVKEADEDAAAKLERAMITSRHAINSSKLAEEMLQAALDLFKHQGVGGGGGGGGIQKDGRCHPMKKTQQLSPMMQSQGPTTMASAVVSSPFARLGRAQSVAANLRRKPSPAGVDYHRAALVSQCNITSHDPALALSQFALLANNGTADSFDTNIDNGQGKKGPTVAEMMEIITGNSAGKTGKVTMPALQQLSPLLDPTVTERVRENTEAIFRQTMRVCQESKEADHRATEAVQRCFLAHHQAEHLRRRASGSSSSSSLPFSMEANDARLPSAPAQTPSKSFSP